MCSFVAQMYVCKAGKGGLRWDAMEWLVMIPLWCRALLCTGCSQRYLVLDLSLAAGPCTRSTRAPQLAVLSLPATLGLQRHHPATLHCVRSCPPMFTLPDRLRNCCRSRTAVAPLERLKILMQVQGNQKVYTGVWQGLKHMARTEGVRGMMKGNLANCIRIVPNSAVKFLTYEQLSRRAAVVITHMSGCRGRSRPEERSLAAVLRVQH